MTQLVRRSSGLALLALACALAAHLLMQVGSARAGASASEGHTAGAAAAVAVPVTGAAASPTGSAEGHDVHLMSLTCSAAVAAVWLSRPAVAAVARQAVSAFLVTDTAMRPSRPGARWHPAWQDSSPIEQGVLLRI